MKLAMLKDTWSAWIRSWDHSEFVVRVSAESHEHEGQRSGIDRDDRDSIRIGIKKKNDKIPTFKRRNS